MNVLPLRKPDKWALFSSYQEAIVAEVDGVALRVGRLLREARELDPDYFPHWVVECLPFGLETARRLMAISAAYEKLPAEMLRSLPRPWQAMYALKELSQDEIQEAIDAGKVRPTMTVAQAKLYAREKRNPGTQIYRKANQIAGKLMRCSPHDLRPAIRKSLQTWLDG